MPYITSIDVCAISSSPASRETAQRAALDKGDVRSGLRIAHSRLKQQVKRQHGAVTGGLTAHVREL